MALTKDKKKEIISEAEKVVKESESTVFVNFHGLTVADSTNLRGNLRNKGLGYKVLKKTLFKRALELAKIDGDMPELSGELAIAYGNDAVMPAKEIAEFAKSNPEKVSILGGVYQNRFLTAEEMKNMASIPTREVLLGMFVNILNSPIQGLVIALNGISEKKS